MRATSAERNPPGAGPRTTTPTFGLTAETHGAMAAAIRAESGGLLGDTEVLSNLRVLQTELTGAGILEPLLCADGTTDVLVTAPDAVWVDDGNGLRRSTIRFSDEAAVRRLAQRLALNAGRRLSLIHI